MLADDRPPAVPNPVAPAPPALLFPSPDPLPPSLSLWLLGLSRFNGQAAKPPAKPRMITMTRQRRRFTAQPKAEAIALRQNDGLTILEASKRLGIHATCLGRWIRQTEIDAQGPTKTGPLSTNERDEMACLKKEIRELKRERDFFKLAAAHFALARRASAYGRSSCRQKVSIHEFGICRLLSQLDG